MKFSTQIVIAFLAVMLASPIAAQTTVTVNCTGAPGSYRSGFVTSGGTLNDGDMTVSNASGTTPKGWAVFDLASLGLPGNATITGATLRINKSAVSGTGGSPACSILGVASDLSVPASAGQGATVFSAITGGTTVNSATWTNAVATVTLTLNAAGVTLLQNNMNGVVSMGLSTTSNRIFTITGYGGTAATQPQLSITFTAPCSGAPLAGTASAPAGVCPGLDFTLNATGMSGGPDISHQWLQFDPGTSSWTPIANATTVPYTVTGGITTATDYQLQVTCANGGGQSVSNTVSVGMNTASQCLVYCTATADFNDEKISNVTVADINHSSTGFGSSGYQNFTAVVGNMTMGVAYPFSATINPFYADDVVAVWIDLDQDGVFADPAEKMLLDIPSASPATGTITVPVTATPGYTRMRVRLAYDNPGVLPCGLEDYGNIEDYTLILTAPPSCTGTPNAVTAAGPTAVCSNTAFTLTASNASFGLGITYQWEQFNAVTSLWDAIPNATNTSFTAAGGITTPADYRFVTTCSNGGGMDNSNTVSVGINPPTQCYCTPAYLNAPSGCSDDDNINTFTLQGENGTAFNDLNTGCSANAYDNRTAQPAVQLALGLSYAGAISSEFGVSEAARIWIDFGDDGTFDATDEVGTMADVPPTASPFNITIPAGAATGNHTMRVRLAYDEIAGTIDPCAAYDYGEVHDYTVSIILPPSCPAPSALTAGTVTPTSASLGWTYGSAVPFSIEYGPQGFTPGTGTFISTSTNPYTLSGLTPATAYSFYVRAVCSSTDSSVQSGPVDFTTLLPNDLPSGAIALTVNGGCTGAPYTNVGYTQSAGEPVPMCRGTNGFRSAWFSFVAPASGFVKVTDDHAGTIGNTKIGVFSGTDPNDMFTFNLLACDDNNAASNKSLLYVNGLTPGTTYYVEVDNMTNGAAAGTFCLTVDEVTSGMLSAGGACAAGVGQSNLNTAYTGWISLVDNSGNLIANVRQSSTSSLSPTGYSVSVNKNTGAVRQTNGVYYLDRNYLITAAGTTTTPAFDVQFFFSDAELNALQAVDPTATLGNINVTRQSGSTCVADFSAGSGTNAVSVQASSGMSNGVTWVQAPTPGFSNFYLTTYIYPLAVELRDIAAVNIGAANRVTWSTASEASGEVFELQRSADGSRFDALTTVNARGVASEYAYLDESPLQGTNYYRLMMTDRTGNKQHSSVVSVNTALPGLRLTAHPNPVQHTVKIALSGPADVQGTITVTDATGKVVVTASLHDQQTEIDMSTLTQGVYLVKYDDGRYSETIRISKL